MNSSIPLFTVHCLLPTNYCYLDSEDVELTPYSDSPISKAQCTDLVARYLAGQGWQLAAPSQLADAIWEDSDRDATFASVRSEILRRYAIVLHDCCLQSEAADYERAWHELRLWLGKNAPRLESHPDTRQEIVQETLIALQRSLSQSPLQRPYSFLTYAFQTMSRQHIDWNRRQTAEKRDWRNTIPLEELDSNQEKDDNGRNWQEFLSASESNWRTIERTVSNQEVRQELLQFAQLHLPTDLQQQVFEAHFLDGLSPAEIARLAGKQPHEIRLIKARIVKKLRELSPETTEQLLDILGRLNDDG